MKMGRYNFEDDITEGINGEKVVLKDLESLGAKFITDNDNRIYDIIVEYKDKKISYEVKTDSFCDYHNDTGNIFVEFESRGKESGISVTKADWFVTYFKNFNEIWYIKTEDLKSLIEGENIPKTKDSGDLGSGTRGYLVNRYKYKDKFIIRKVDNEQKQTKTNG